jgi:hypothetical protein
MTYQPERIAKQFTNNYAGGILPTDIETPHPAFSMNVKRTESMKPEARHRAQVLNRKDQRIHSLYDKA